MDEEDLSVDVVLDNAKVYFQGRIVEAGVAVDRGRIVKVAKKTNLPFASSEIDLKGALVLPGMIDAHVHLRGQRRAHEEDFLTGTAAAVAGGITSVLDMPNNDPVTMDPASLRERKQAARDGIFANVGFYSAFPEDVHDIAQLVKEGVVAFKLYLMAQVGGLNIDDDKALLRAFARVAELGVPVAVHAESKERVTRITEREQNLGHENIEAYLKAHKPEAEVKAVGRILRFARQSNLHVHFCHISSNKAVRLIHEARSKGLRVTCEVTPHHLLLTTDDLRRMGTKSLTDPPVRSKKTLNGLWRAVKNRQIDIVASDHAPHLRAEEAGGSVWDVTPGIPGLETLMPLLLTEVNKGRLTLDALIRLLSAKPAEVFGLQDKGSLRKGCSANLTVVDMHRRGRINVGKFFSKAKYSPFEGWSVTGMPVKTFVNGLLVMDEGEVLAEVKAGKILEGRTSRDS